MNLATLYKTVNEDKLAFNEPCNPTREHEFVNSKPRLTNPL
jgi:hypothetical protein